MLFLRTAAGGFVDAATIVRLCEEADGWIAICGDDREVALAVCYSAPGVVGPRASISEYQPLP
jgi:hypothetical protein